MKKDFLRILDANFNRVKEALRVIEDLMRFNKSDLRLTYQLKQCRHEVSSVLLSLGVRYKELLQSRDVPNDRTRKRVIQDKKRKALRMEDVAVANFKRAQESVRVLEEVLKLINIKLSIRLQNLRFSLYELEKKVIRKF